MSDTLQITQSFFNKLTFFTQWHLTLSKNEKYYRKHAQAACSFTEAVNQKVDSINLVVCSGTRAWEGKQTNRAAAAAALTHGPHSQPPPTSLCSSEKKPLLFPSTGREGGLWGEPPLSSTTPPAIKKKEGTGLPTPAWRPPHSFPASAHKHRLISSTTTTVVIVFSCT